MDVVDDLSSFEMMYMPGQGLTGNNESLLNFHRQQHHHHHNHPAFNGGVAGGDPNANTTAIDDPGGMDFDYIGGNSTACITLDPTASSPTTALFQFVVNGLGISIVAVLGIFGNILSAIVLSRPQMKSSVTCLLLGLAFCDTLLISVSILVFSMPFLNDYVHSSFLWKYENIYFRLWVPYLYPVSITAQTGSVYLTLAVTIERYIAVCHSLKARSICTWRRARICVAAVFLFSILYNMPRWWEVISMPFCDPVNNMTIYTNGKSLMRDNPTYVTVYINWAYLVVMYLIPFSGLVVFNLAIYRQVRKANRERQQLSKLQRREMGLATMLLCVVVVFLLCNVLPLVNNILETWYDTSVDQLVAISNFLVVVNSSVNFVIYCTCGERFRRLLIRLCRDFVGCRLGTRNNYRGSLYRKSHYYRDSPIYLIDLPAREYRGRPISVVVGPGNATTTANGTPSGGVPRARSGAPSSSFRDFPCQQDHHLHHQRKCMSLSADFEEMSMASVANHTCLTTNGGPNGTVVVDLSSGHKANNNGALRGNNNYNRDRNKTIPLLHVHAAAHHHHHHHGSHHNNHTSHHHHHHNNHLNHNNHHHAHSVHNNSNGSAPNNGSTQPTTVAGTTTGPLGVVATNIPIASTGGGSGIATGMINNNNGRAHVGRRVSSPVGPT